MLSSDIVIHDAIDTWPKGKTRGSRSDRQLL